MGRERAHRGLSFAGCVREACARGWFPKQFLPRKRLFGRGWEPAPGPGRVGTDRGAEMLWIIPFVEQRIQYMIDQIVAGGL